MRQKRIAVTTVVAACTALLAAFPAVSAEEERSDFYSKFSVSAGVSFLFLQDTASYEGSSGDISKGMGMSTEGSYRAFWKPVPVLTQSWSFHPNFSLELKERFWFYTVKASSYFAPELNYELEKYVVPLTVSIKASISSPNRRIGGYLFAAPGLYIVRASESGWFGSRGADTYVKPGVHAGAGMLIGLIPGRFNLRLEGAYDWFEIERSNKLIKDGGIGGGGSATALLEVSF